MRHLNKVKNYTTKQRKVKVSFKMDKKINQSPSWSCLSPDSGQFQTPSSHWSMHKRHSLFREVCLRLIHLFEFLFFHPFFKFFFHLSDSHIDCFVLFSFSFVLFFLLSLMHIIPHQSVYLARGNFLSVITIRFAAS